jgi:hypothetical protein
MTKVEAPVGRPHAPIGKGRVAPTPQDVFREIIAETLDKKLAGDLDPAERRRLEDYRFQVTNAVEPLIGRLKIDFLENDPVASDDWVSVILKTAAFLGQLGGVKKKTLSEN